MAKPTDKKTTKKQSSSKSVTEPKARIRKLTMAELEEVVGGTAAPGEIGASTYSGFAGNSTNWGKTC